MSFNKEGTFKGKVLEVAMADAKFSKNPNAFDIWIKVDGPDGQSGYWRGEVSTDFGKGNLASKTQMQITLELLQSVGFQGNDFGQVEAQLLGKEIEYVVESRVYNDKTYYDVKYLGGGAGGPSGKMDPNEMARRMAAMTQGGVQPAAPAPAPAMPAAQAPVAQQYTQAPTAPVAAPAPAAPAAPAPAPGTSW